MIEKFTDEEKEELLKELLEWKEKLNKEREKELEDNAMANLKSNAKIIFDKFPEVDKIQLSWCGKAYDAPYESFCNIDVEFIPVKDGVDYDPLEHSDLNISYEELSKLKSSIEKVIPKSLLGGQHDADDCYPGHGYQSFILRDLTTGWMEQ